MNHRAPSPGYQQQGGVGMGGVQQQQLGGMGGQMVDGSNTTLASLHQHSPSLNSSSHTMRSGSLTRPMSPSPSLTSDKVEQDFQVSEQFHPYEMRWDDEWHSTRLIFPYERWRGGMKPPRQRFPHFPFMYKIFKWWVLYGYYMTTCISSYLLLYACWIYTGHSLITVRYLFLFASMLRSGHCASIRIDRKEKKRSARDDCSCTFSCRAASPTRLTPNNQPTWPRGNWKSPSNSSSRSSSVSRWQSFGVV